MDWCPDLDPAEWDGLQSEDAVVSKIRIKLWPRDIKTPFARIAIHSFGRLERIWRQQLVFAFDEVGLPPSLLPACCDVAIAFAKADSEF